MVNNDSFFSFQYFKYYDVQRVGASGQKHIVPRYIIVYVDTWVVKSARRGDRLNCCIVSIVFIGISTKIILSNSRTISIQGD